MLNGTPKMVHRSAEDGVLTYHTAKGSHHGGEYYTVGTVETGKEWYDMHGDPID